MSTADPRIARAEREARSNDNGSAGLIAGGLALLHVALFALAGYGFLNVADTFRLMSMNQVGDGWDSTLEDIPVLFLIGIFAGSITGFAVTGRVGRVLGFGPGMVAPFVTAFLGLAIGLGISISRWTPPELVGEKKPFIDGPTEPWGFDAWLAYYVPYILPAVCAALFVVLLLVFVRAVFAARAKGQLIENLVTTGTKVAGVVTEVLPTGSEINGQPLVGFTVKFTDHNRVERWVQKKGTFPSALVPRAGDAAVVWFDQNDPGNQKRIAVGLGPDAEQAMKAGRPPMR